MSIKARPHVIAVLLVTVGVAIPAVMMIYGSTALGITYKDWTWIALPITAVLTVGSALVAFRRPMIGGVLLVVTCAPAATIFWRELGILTFGGAWLIGGWIYFAAARRLLETPRPEPDATRTSLARTREAGSAAPERASTTTE